MPQRTVKKILLICTLVALLVGLGLVSFEYWRTRDLVSDSIDSLRQAVTKDLNDPEGARLRNVRLISLEGKISQRMELLDAQFLLESTPQEVLAIFRYDRKLLRLCGEVNAKNRLGAYVGYMPFFARNPDKPEAYIDADPRDDFARKMCEIGKESIVRIVADSASGSR
jgi:hypothetical protein